MSEARYGADYFAWQRSIGEAGAILNQRKFASWITPTDTVLDFGCGSGALLAALPGRQKIGVEIGAEARAAAASLGLTVFAQTSEVGTETVDVLISNHALEHVERPLDELRELRRVLKPGGVAVLVVPIDDWRSQRTANPSDPNHHLYTWTPLLFSNLLTDAGFEVESCSVMTHAWRRKSLLLRSMLPAPLYDATAWSLAALSRRRQIHALALRPR